MKEINQEIMALLNKYEGDLKRALKENRRLEYLYALSVLRENLLEWFEFKRDASLLQVGADFGALTGLFSRRVQDVTVLDEDEESLEVVRLRYKAVDNISCRSGSFKTFERGKLFDYVTLIGSLRQPFKEQIEAAMSLLKPGGILLLAACNSLGMKYLSGAEADSFSITKKQLEHLLPGGDFYYPMPDYKVPSGVYSERYLPKKGDLTRTLTLYDYPAYSSLNVGAYYDIVCEDGQFENFANSFLVLWKKGEQI